MNPNVMPKKASPVRVRVRNPKFNPTMAEALRKAGWVR